MSLELKTGMRTLTFGLLLSLVSCAGNDVADEGESLAITYVWQSAQCATGVESTLLIESKSAMTEWWNKVNKLILPRPNLPESLRGVDFNKENVIAIYMGEKSTAGYGLELERRFATLHNDELSIYVKEITPAEGAMHLQMTTRPCLVVSTAKHKFAKVKINR